MIQDISNKAVEDALRDNIKKESDLFEKRIAAKKKEAEAADRTAGLYHIIPFLPDNNVLTLEGKLALTSKNSPPVADDKQLSINMREAEDLRNEVMVRHNIADQTAALAKNASPEGTESPSLLSSKRAATEAAEKGELSLKAVSFQKRVDQEVAKKDLTDTGRQQVLASHQLASDTMGSSESSGHGERPHPTYQPPVPLPAVSTEQAASILTYPFQRWSGDHSVQISFPAHNRPAHTTLLPSGVYVANVLSNHVAHLPGEPPEILSPLQGDDDRHKRPDFQDEEQ